MSPEAVIDLQVEAFNRGDVDSLAACYADDATIANPISDEAPLSGLAAIRERYAALFIELPDVRMAVLRRFIVGSIVTDHEDIPSLGAQAVATYEVKDDLIRRAWLFGPLQASADACSHPQPKEYLISCSISALSPPRHSGGLRAPDKVMGAVFPPAPTPPPSICLLGALRFESAERLR